MAVKKKARAKAAPRRRKTRRPVSGKKAVKKTGRPAPKKRKKQAPKKEELNLEKIGEVTHYFPHVKAAAVMVLKDGIKIGDQIYIKGHTTDFKERVGSIQLDRVAIQEGKKGQEVGLLVKSRVRIGDTVYRV